MRSAVTLALALLLGPAAARAQSGDPRARTRTRECETCARDSSKQIMRLRLDHRDQFERASKLAEELTALRRSLDDEGQRLSASERRRLHLRAGRLESELDRITSRLSLDTQRAFQEVEPAMVEARRAIAAAMAEAGAVAFDAPRFPGWIGITLDAPCVVEAKGGDVFWRFFDHPQIVSVDPSSPADRAGIRQGDVLLAYDGQDVRKQIAMNRLLQPGRTVRVRVRVQRQNEVRELPVTIAPVRELAWRDRGSEPGGMMRRPDAPKSPRAGEGMWGVRVPAPERMPMPPMEPMPAPEPAPAPGPTIAIWRTANGLAGARMETITRGLGETIGIERGVLVIAVPRGVPAYESGLLDGDVIVKADGRDVASVQELRQVLAESADRAVKLDVTRKGKSRQVRLRW